MNAKKDADSPLAVVRTIAPEPVRSSRNLEVTVDPDQLSAALAAVIPHVSAKKGSPLNRVRMVFTPTRLLLCARCGSTSAAVVVPGYASGVTGHVDSDSIELTPAMARTLSAVFSRRREEDDPGSLEVRVSGTTEHNIRLHAIEVAGLFDGNELEMSVLGPGEPTAKALQVLETASTTGTRTRLVDVVPAGSMSRFVTSAQKLDSDIEIEVVGEEELRVHIGSQFVGHIWAPVDADEVAWRSRRRSDARQNWQSILAGMGPAPS